MEQRASKNLLPIIGTWRLISWERHSSNGEVTHPFGENPYGLLIYTETGHISAQIMRPDDLNSHQESYLRELQRRLRLAIGVYYHITDVSNTTALVRSCCIMWRVLGFQIWKGNPRNDSLNCQEIA